MAFNQYNLERVYDQQRGGFDLFVYSTGDSIADVIADGYFTTQEFGFASPGASPKLIIANCLDGIYHLEWDTSSASASVINSGISTTGWASYVDTQYTQASPFTLLTGSAANLPNNAGTVIDSQKPIDIGTFWDSAAQKITGRTGDNLDAMIYFKAVPSAANQYLDVWVDIGGAIGELYRQTFSFPRGSGTPRGILYSLPSAYTLGTWEANGGEVFVESNADVDIYDINFNFDRSHKAV